MNAEFRILFTGGTDTPPLDPGVCTIVLRRADKKQSAARGYPNFRYFVYRESHRPLVEGDLHLGFLPAEKDDEPVTHIPEPEISWGFADAGRFPPFFTLQPSMQSYRNVVERCGLEWGRQVLIAIRDLVAIKNMSVKRQLFEEAKKTKQFAMQFMRNSESFFAYHNAEFVLRGVETTEVSSLSTALRLQFKLPTFANDHVLDFTFDHISELPRRMAVIIGKNGTGKSQSLFNVADSLLNNDERLRTGPAFRDRPLVNRLLAVCSPGETYSTFPAQGRSRRMMYRRVMLGRPAPGMGRLGLGDVLVQLARSSETIKGMSRWELFVDAISSVLNPADVYLPCTDLNWPRKVRRIQSFDRHEDSGSAKPIRVTEMLLGDTDTQIARWAAVDGLADPCRFVDGQVVPLSSGQLTFMRFAAQVCLFVENGTLVLVEEPETHLHPNLICDFVALLDRLLVRTGSLAILATHSSYFVRELPRSQIVVLREGPDGDIQVLKPRLRTLGADVGSISQFVFEDEQFGANISRYGMRLTKMQPGEGDKWLASIEAELSPEASMYLRRRQEPEGGTK